MFVTKQLMDPIDFHIMGGKKSMAIPSTGLRHSSKYLLNSKINSKEINTGLEQLDGE